jgi:hypothetical protein
MNRTFNAMAVALALAGLAGAPLAFAQNNRDAKQPTRPNGMQEMMQGTQGDGMGMMNMMTQMNQMAETCNKMMQAMLPNQEKPAGEEKQPNKG